MYIRHVVELNQEELTAILKATLFQNLNVNFKFSSENIVVDYTQFFLNGPQNERKIRATLDIENYTLLINDSDN